MADPDPNDKVTLAGSGVLLHVLRSTDSVPIPLVGDPSGSLTTSGTSSVATGTAFVVVAQSIPLAATQLTASTWPLGFAIQNLDATNPIYVGPTAAVTDANGWRIAAGEQETFILPNSNLLYAIATGGAVSVRIGGVT